MKFIMEVIYEDAFHQVHSIRMNIKLYLEDPDLLCFPPRNEGYHPNVKAEVRDMFGQPIFNPEYEEDLDELWQTLYSPGPFLEILRIKLSSFSIGEFDLERIKKHLKKDNPQTKDYTDCEVKEKIEQYFNISFGISVHPDGFYDLVYRYPFHEQEIVDFIEHKDNLLEMRKEFLKTEFEEYD